VSSSKPISILVPYYRSPEALEFQLNHWDRYSTEIKKMLRFVVVDDGSPEPLVINKNPREGIHLRAYRVKENIPWNVSGAKNLLVDRCETPWFLMHDIDHFITEKYLGPLMILERNDNIAYHLSRPTKGGHSPKKSIITLFMPKILFHKLGGYDEDFAGIRGDIDNELYDRMKAREIDIRWKKHIRMSDCHHIPDSMVSDWPRATGITVPPKRTGKSILRFKWEKVC